MKKTYSNPTINVVVISTQQMLAISDRFFNNVDANTDGNDDYTDGRDFDLDDEY